MAKRIIKYNISVLMELLAKFTDGPIIIEVDHQRMEANTPEKIQGILGGLGCVTFVVKTKHFNWVCSKLSATVYTTKNDVNRWLKQFNLGSYRNAK